MPISWQVINSMFHYQCQNVLGLIDLILTLPAASTDTERGFSKMKYAKNDFRSCLLDDNLTDQMMIMHDGKTESTFDLYPAIHLWNQSSTRGKNSFV